MYGPWPQEPIYCEWLRCLLTLQQSTLGPTLIPGNLTIWQEEALAILFKPAPGSNTLEQCDKNSHFPFYKSLQDGRHALSLPFFLSCSGYLSFFSSPALAMNCSQGLLFFLLSCHSFSCIIVSLSFLFLFCFLVFLYLTQPCSQIHS